LGLVLPDVWKKLYLAGPLIEALMLQKIVQMIYVMFICHLGEFSLSNASISRHHQTTYSEFIRQ
jgi:hypothetical protein